jgi:hypothetical protein
VVLCGMFPVALLEAAELALFPCVTWPVFPPWPTRTPTLPFCAPDCWALASDSTSCVLLLGGFSEVAGGVSDGSVDVPSAGGPVDVADDPVMPGVPAVSTMT